MVNLALIGLGYWGPNLLRNLSSLEGVKIVALCDLDVKRAEAFRQRLCPDARVVSDYRVLANDSQIEAVVIVTPIRLHYEIGSFFLASGKHVLLEKPLAGTTQECLSLIELADRQQRVLMLSYVFEFDAAVQRT